MVRRPGRPSYYADFVHKGKRVQKRLSRDYKTAVEILNALRARLDREDFGLLDNDYPLADLQRSYLQAVKQTRSPKTHAAYAAALRRVLGWLAVANVRQLDIGRLHAYRESRLAVVSGRTVNAEVGTLVAMLRWGVQTRAIGSNPLAGLERLPEVEHEGRALTDDEVRRLLAVGGDWREVWYAFLTTGLRSSELCALTWPAVDWDSREIEVVGKGRKRRRIPLEDGLHAILERCRAPSGPVFPIARRRARVLRWFRHDCRAAGIAGCTVHDLRRTFATNLLANGADPKSVQDILGHATLTLTMRTYVRLHQDHHRAAVGKLSYALPNPLPLSEERKQSS